MHTHTQTQMCYAYNMSPLLLNPGYFLGLRVNLGFTNHIGVKLDFTLGFTPKNMGLPLNLHFLPLFPAAKHGFAVSGSCLAGSIEGNTYFCFKYEHVYVNEFAYKPNRCKPNQNHGYSPIHAWLAQPRGIHIFALSMNIYT